MEEEQNEHHLVAEFIQTFKASLDPRLWVKLMQEELKEFNESIHGSKESLKEIADVLYVHSGFLLVLGGGIEEGLISKEEEHEWRRTIYEVKEAFSMAQEVFDVATIWEAFERVHASNMSKLGVNGKPIFRDDGKVLKGPNYKEPDLTDLVERVTIT